MKDLGTLLLSGPVFDHCRRIYNRGDDEKTNNTLRDIFALEEIANKHFKNGACSMFIKEGEKEIDGHYMYNAGPYFKERKHLAYIDLRGTFNARARIIGDVSKYADERHITMYFSVDWVGLNVSPN